MQIFSGSSNPDLAKKIAKLMQSQSSDHSPKIAQGSELLGQIEISKFANGEKRVRVVNRGKGEVAVIQSFSAPTDEHLIEFCLICDALHRGGATEITAVIPWLGYSKQDKVFLPGEPLSAKVIAQIIQTTKIKKLVTFDLHNRAITGFFDIPVTELSAKPLLSEYFKKQLGGKSSDHSPKIAQGSELGEGDTVVVAPDEGSVKASAYFARELGVAIAYMDKRRSLKTGKVEVVSMTGKVKGKDVIILDDMIVTGSTMMESAKFLKSKGARSVRVAATHHLYVPGVQEKLENSEIDEIVVTDTVSKIRNPKYEIRNKSEIRNSKLKVLSVAQLVVDEIK